MVFVGTVEESPILPDSGVDGGSIRVTDTLQGTRFCVSSIIVFYQGITFLSLLYVIYNNGLTASFLFSEFAKLAILAAIKHWENTLPCMGKWKDINNLDSSKRPRDYIRFIKGEG